MTTERAVWTIAYRKATGPWFQRVDLELTWDQAAMAATALLLVRPDLEVWYTTNHHWDAQVVEDARHNSSQLVRDRLEDVGNVLAGNGKRIKVKDTGKLDPRVCILSDEQARVARKSRSSR
jgi:hypothetical protein